MNDSDNDDDNNKNNNGARNTSCEGLLALLRKPESFGVALLDVGQQQSDEPTEGADLRRQLQQTCQTLFQRVEQLAAYYNQHVLFENVGGGKSEHYTLSGLDGLHFPQPQQPGKNGAESIMDAVNDTEVIFGQIEVQNAALQKLLKNSNKALSRSVESRKEVRLLEDDLEESDEVRQNVSMESEDSGKDEESSDEDEEERRARERMERVMGEMEESDEDDDDGEEEEARTKTNDARVVDNDGESIEDPAAEELNDGFFDINEMEAFADEEEEYLPDEAFGQEDSEPPKIKDNRSFHQRLRDGDEASESDDEEDDDEEDEEEVEDLMFRAKSTVRRKRYREDDEINALFKLYEKPQSGSDDNDDDDDDDLDVTQMTAADLFGKPKKKYYDKWYGSNSKNKIQKKPLLQPNNSKKKKPQNVTKKDDDDSWDEYDFEGAEEREDASGWNDEKPKQSSLKGNKEHLEDEGDDSNRKSKSSKPSSKPKNRQEEKLNKQIEILENDMIAEKPWKMKGEIPGTARPVDSLLDSTPEFEIAAKQAPVITVEKTADLEEVIKKRILDEDWDDVIPRELPDVAWNKKKGELPEVGQEKSKLGLGELYEREYLKKVAGYDADAAEKETEEEKAKNEMRTLFANLCSKLDALSNYHFVPRPVAEEAEIRPLAQAAIAMEEVLPLHVSDARGVAPEEVYVAKRGREGVLRGDSEWEQQEKKRLRSSKKAARRKARKEKLADEKLITRLQPGLGLNNPYEKRKMREELAAARARGKVSTGQEDTNSYGKSTTFFKRMQSEARAAIVAQQDSAATGDNSGKKQAKSSALKL